MVVKREGGVGKLIDVKGKRNKRKRDILNVLLYESFQ